MMGLIERYYRLLIRAGSSLHSPFLLAVRLYWGWQFMQTGWGKLTDIGKVVGFFADLGNRRGFEFADFFQDGLRQNPAHLHCTGCR